ncbi:P-loop containing nucleoside triphosphate hydrolase protein [Annulohypoxylon truncatum]|uniref:P-loop containing nucleoside triphosphate hydrolase protein n=1 Tax=Annulohypoxylon truncatum TaxID=327061 RepID=UPI002007952E|nr:P-loop containing nucleoside triphosphate hydrolase protein [Annulohypoxylon truncatum]KAI1209566.1 P-loop containing nucleoside triphosphate hydrolase protein [Annulohypoxylon truncatum]
MASRTVTEAYFDHSTAKRVNTDSIIVQALRQEYPNLELVIAPEGSSNLLAYASAGHASFSVIEDGGNLPPVVSWKVYIPSARRMDGGNGILADRIVFGKFLYKWNDSEFIVYRIEGRDGSGSYPSVNNYYILTTDIPKADALCVAAGQWSSELHDEIWVFDGGYWQKNAALYQSVMGSSWDSVILDEEMKQAIINDHLSFFNSQETYKNLKVPWKRGIIYYGPPGNGKTISIKAMMRTLYSRKDPIPTLYVRSLTSYTGPESSIKQIFIKARQFAPCYLVFEDLDTIVSDNVRSYFLNEVDGLKSNDGIFMIGSTNHLDRLDPGISKRPSRFDRKYLFPDPDLDQRIAYCKFWQSKLANNKEIEFPDKLCSAIASITDKFSFAYMQEAFVAALLAIARTGEGIDPNYELPLTQEMNDGWVGVLGGDDDLDGLVLWKEIKKQVAILRESMEEQQ